ncbi:MAG: hypothetical protein KDA54_07900 [Phycisphaerales bacterium]|nr:hypothetical protein [Phycisphaerales bacterium]
MTNVSIDLQSRNWRLWGQDSTIRCFANVRQVLRHLQDHLRANSANPNGQEATAWEQCRARRVPDRQSFGHSDQYDYETWLDLLSHAFDFADSARVSIRYLDRSFELVSDITLPSYPKGIPKRQAELRYIVLAPWGYYAVAAELGPGSAVLLSGVFPRHAWITNHRRPYDAFRAVTDQVVVKYLARKGRENRKYMEYNEISEIEFLADESWLESYSEPEFKGWLRSWISERRTVSLMQDEVNLTKNDAIPVRETHFQRYLRKWGQAGFGDEGSTHD